MGAIDAVVVGSGPNGLAAAVTLARAGLTVQVLERNETVGGGCRTGELTLPGFRHDLGAAVHPLALQSPFFRAFGLHRRVELISPEVQYAHPLDDGSVGPAFRDIDRTVDLLGSDGPAWRRLFAPLVRRVDAVASAATSSLLAMPSAPWTSALLGMRMLEQGSPAWSTRFNGRLAPAMLTGLAAHANQPLPSWSAAAVGLALGTYAHGRGWPLPVGGSQAIIDALVADLEQHGGSIQTGAEVTSFGDLPTARAVLFDTSAAGMVRILGARLPGRYRASLRSFRFGNGVGKVDFALNSPVPWRSELLAQAGTVHLGGSRDAIAAAERDVTRGTHAARPYVLLAQPSVVDPSRAPAGKHVLWAYAHVPAGSTIDQTEAITREIERHAPGFRDTILATRSRTAAELTAENPNYVGGDISTGSASFLQLLRRPVLSPTPWRTPLDGAYLCSAATTPGPGVHGMAGWRAATTALRERFGIEVPPPLSPETGHALP